jgi:hypothetical protein
MDSQLDHLLPYISSRKATNADHRYGKKGAANQEGSFRCKTCQAYVHAIPVLSGVHNRNHCPFCLWSRHVDLRHSGDRLSACKASMQPIGLTVKRGRDKYGYQQHGELMLIHHCSECGAVSINRIAADDTVDGLESILQVSSSLDNLILHQLETVGIHLLQMDDVELVEGQLFGKVKL